MISQVGVSFSLGSTYHPLFLHSTESVTLTVTTDLFVHVATFAKSVAFHKWKYVLCYLIVYSIISLSCCLYLSTARPTVGAGFGRGLGQPSEGLHERARVPSGFTLWQPAGW